MGMTVYLFDRWQKVRRIIPPGGVKKLIHDEGAYTLEAEITIDIPISPGEHLGFLCVDGRFRLFEVSSANENDAYHVWEINATDASVVELKGIIREDMQLIDLTLTDALQSLLPETWKITGTAPDRVEKSRAYYATVWGMITTYEALYEWRIIPHYEFSDGQITGRVIELMEDKPVFRGRILHSNLDAQKLYVKNSRRPITALYGLGPSQGTQDVQTNLTFADIEWSVANGDPVDKPKGQAWVGLPEAEIMYPEYTAVISITDAEDANDLLQKTWDNLQELKNPSVNVEAFVTDVQYEPDMSGRALRIGDLVTVKAKSGQTIEAKIIGIKRDYIEEDLTEIKAGDKTETITRQVSDLIKSATHTFERLTVYQNRFVENENLIMLNADHIQLNADYIKQTADNVELLANRIELVANDVVSIKGNMVTLEALEITLIGYVKATDMETETLKVLESARVPDLKALAFTCSGQANINTLYATGSVIGSLVVGEGGISTPTLSIGGDALEKTSMYVITNVTPTINSAGYVIGVDTSGTTISFYA